MSIYMLTNAGGSGQLVILSSYSETSYVQLNQCVTANPTQQITNMMADEITPCCYLGT